MLYILLTILLPILTYYFVIKPHQYWKRRGAKQDQPWPVLGSNVDFLFNKSTVTEISERQYKYLPYLRYHGSYQFLNPVLILKDVDLIKQMLIKDFDHFTDHQTFFPEGSDELWNKNLFALKGEKWKVMRSLLSPNFTSSKMKMMFTLMEEVAEQYIHKIMKDPVKTDVDVVSLFSRFANDVIATTAFGIQVDSYTNKDNEFYLMGKQLTSFQSFFAQLKFILVASSPKFAKYLGLKFFDKKAAKFFKDLVCQTVRVREEQNIVRPDLIHLLMEARKGNEMHNESSEKSSGFATVEDSHIDKKKSKRLNITDIDICANAILFFFAGFDTVSQMMSFTCYELAVNQDVQEKLREEINETLKECEGKVTYDALMKMKYMDMVISEGLRLWPNVVNLDRQCTKEYTINPELPNERPVVIEQDTVLELPVFAIHRDEKYYENPDKFDPERFSDENKDKINPYAYMPFGIGPRACIGSRFALMEMKILFFHILSNMRIKPSARTPVPMKLKKGFVLLADPGLFMDFIPLK